MAGADYSGYTNSSGAILSRVHQNESRIVNVIEGSTGSLGSWLSEVYLKLHYRLIWRHASDLADITNLYTVRPSLPLSLSLPPSLSSLPSSLLLFPFLTISSVHSPGSFCYSLPPSIHPPTIHIQNFIHPSIHPVFSFPSPFSTNTTHYLVPAHTTQTIDKISEFACCRETRGAEQELFYPRGCRKVRLLDLPVSKRWDHHWCEPGTATDDFISFPFDQREKPTYEHADEFHKLVFGN